MRFTIAGRQTGKTRKLMKLMLIDPKLVMICHNKQAADDALRTFEYSVARQDGAGKDRFITIEEAVSYRMRGMKQRPAVIDNLDLCIHVLLGRYFEIYDVAATGLMESL